MESAAPIPVPVQIRIPRLYRVDVFETPANCAHVSMWAGNTASSSHLQFTRPKGLWRVTNETFGEITLHTSNQEVVLGVRALTAQND